MLSFYDCVMAALLDVKSLTIELPTTAGWIRPVNDVSFSLNEGETLGIVGESGSGKTMLALALMRLLPHGARAKGAAFLSSRGDKAVLNGLPSTDLISISAPEMQRIRGREIAMIFQEPMTALNPVMRIGTRLQKRFARIEPTREQNGSTPPCGGRPGTCCRSRAGNARGAISPPIFRWLASTRDDCDGAGCGSSAFVDRGRAMTLRPSSDCAKTDSGSAGPIAAATAASG